MESLTDLQTGESPADPQAVKSETAQLLYLLFPLFMGTAFYC